MIYTGYFAHTKDYVEQGIRPISIAQVTPAFFTYKKWKVFAPSFSLVKRWKDNKISWEEYEKEYIEHLEKHITEERLAYIKNIHDKEKVVLCCYETPEKHCHRDIVAQWLGDKLGIFIGELG